MPDPTIDPVQARVREIIQGPIEALVEIGMDGEQAAIGLLAFQYLNRLMIADEREELERLRDEIDGYLEDDDDDEPPALRVVN